MQALLCATVRRGAEDPAYLPRVTWGTESSMFRDWASCDSAAPAVGFAMVSAIAYQNEVPFDGVPCLLLACAVFAARLLLCCTYDCYGIAG
jgi:hypothetical protein